MFIHILSTGIGKCHERANDIISWNNHYYMIHIDCTMPRINWTRRTSMGQRLLNVTLRATGVIHVTEFELHGHSCLPLRNQSFDRAFDSQIYDDIVATYLVLEKGLIGEKIRTQMVIIECNIFITDKESMSEHLLDLQTRSIRDNWLFFNFDESGNDDERHNEKKMNETFITILWKRVRYTRGYI